ncbi:MAG: SRPBCC family protein [Anaerolineae bacterium]
MPAIRKNIIVNVPSDRVWAILTDPAHSHKLNDCVKPHCFFESKVGGYDSIFDYRMGGKWLRAKSCMTVYVEPSHLAYQTSGNLISKWHWWLESDGRLTHVSLTMDYDLPVSLAGMDVATLETENKQALDLSLQNLKRISEKS